MAWVTPSNVATGDVLTASKWNQDVVENTNVLYNSVRRLAVRTRSAVVASGASVAAAAELFSTDLTFTSDGTSEYQVELFVPYLESATNGGAYLEVHLTNGAGVSSGYVGYFGKGNGTYSAIGSHRSVWQRTFSAGTVTLNVAFVHIVAAGQAGSVTGAPAWLAVYGPDVS